MDQQPVFLNIQLNVDQINVILATLGKLPYETIAPLMGSIQAQATQQLQQLQAQAAQNDGSDAGFSESDNTVQ